MTEIGTPNPYPGSAKGQNIAIIIIVIVVLAIVVWIISKVFGSFSNLFGGLGKLGHGALQGLGLEDTPQDKENLDAILAEQQKASLASSPWNSTFYKSSPEGTKLVTRAKQDANAKQIWDSVSIFGDTPLAALAVFKTFTNQAQVSWLVDVFNQNYQQDLYNWMAYHYDTSAQKANLVSIVNFVNSLPKYN